MSCVLFWLLLKKLNSNVRSGYMFLYKIVLFSLGIIVAILLKIKKTHEFKKKQKTEFEGEMEKFPKHF